MFLSEWMCSMFDGTTIELHLIDDSFWVSYNSICILTIKTIYSLPNRELSEAKSIENNIFISLNQWDFHDTKIDILKLPDTHVQKNKWYKARIRGDGCYDIKDYIGLGYMGIFAWNNKIIHGESIKKNDVLQKNSTRKVLFGVTNGAQES